MLDGVVGQHAPIKRGKPSAGPSIRYVRIVRTVLDRVAEVARASASAAFGLGVGHAGLGMTWTTVPGPSRSQSSRSDRVDLDDRIDEQIACRPFELGPGKLAFDEEAATGVDRPRTVVPRFAGVEGKPLAEPIHLAGGGFDLDMPKHRR